jgi:hypothetical protein
MMLRSGTTKHGKNMTDSANKQSMGGLSGGGGSLGGGDGMGVVGGDSEYINVAAKTLDLEEIDKETLHLLVFLFMQFLSTPEQVKKIL